MFMSKEAAHIQKSASAQSAPVEDEGLRSSLKFCVLMESSRGLH